MPRRACPACRTAIAPGWSICPSCGATVPGDARPWLWPAGLLAALVAAVAVLAGVAVTSKPRPAAVVAEGGRAPKAPPPVAAKPEPPPPAAVAPKPEPKPEPAKDETIVAKLNCVPFWEEYGKNVAAADMKYKGKLVQLTGRIERVDKDNDGYFVSLVCVSGEGWGPNVVCRFGQDDAAEFAKIKPQEGVTLVARVVGYRRSAAAFREYAVDLKDARISR